MFDGHRERGPIQVQHPVRHSLYCLGLATSDPVDSPELFCKFGHVKKNQEGSDVTEVDEVVRMTSHKMKTGFWHVL
jgi:hypothetical protein